MHNDQCTLRLCMHLVRYHSYHIFHLFHAQIGLKHYSYWACCQKLSHSSYVILRKTLTNKGVDAHPLELTVGHWTQVDLFVRIKRLVSAKLGRTVNDPVDSNLKWTK